MDRTPLASSSVLELLAGDSVLRATSVPATFWDKAVVVAVVVAASDDDAGGGGGRPLGPLTLSNRRTGLSALLMWGMLNSGGGGWV